MADLAVALVTCSKLTSPCEDARALQPLLADRGLRLAHPCWNDPEVDWSEFALVLVRSTWDYHLHHADFLAWIDGLEAAGVRLWNPPEVLRWNSDKTYLEDLEAAGVPITPTGWIEQGGLIDLGAVLELEGWDEAVVKPTVSAGAHETFATSASRAARDAQRLQDLVREQAMMIQQLLPEVRTQGELSLMFLDGEFTHAVRKLPAEGDFRVQEHMGGRSEAAEVSDATVAAARKALDAAERPWLYARVDGVLQKKTFVLMELELIEPSLFLGLDASGKAAARLADAIARLATE